MENIFALSIEYACDLETEKIQRLHRFCTVNKRAAAVFLERKPLLPACFFDRQGWLIYVVFLFNTKNPAQNTAEHFGAFHNDDFHMRASHQFFPQEQPMRTRAIAARISITLGGHRVAVSKPAPKAKKNTPEPLLLLRFIKNTVPHSADRIAAIPASQYQHIPGR